MNQAVFRHSARILPLKDSAKALSVGLPGRLKFKVTPPLVDPQIQVAGDEFRAVVDPNDPWIANSLPGPLERLDGIAGLVGEPRIQRRREPAEGVDDRQDADLAPVEQLVMQEIHGPDIVGAGGWPLTSQRRSSSCRRLSSAIADHRAIVPRPGRRASGPSFLKPAEKSSSSQGSSSSRPGSRERYRLPRRATSEGSSR